MCAGHCSGLLATLAAISFLLIMLPVKKSCIVAYVFAFNLCSKCRQIAKTGLLAVSKKMRDRMTFAVDLFRFSWLCPLFVIIIITLIIMINTVITE